MHCSFILMDACPGIFVTQGIASSVEHFEVVLGKFWQAGAIPPARASTEVQAIFQAVLGDAGHWK